MADLKTLVEREMHRGGHPSYSLADLGRRRRRSERNRRVGTAVVALAVVAAAVGGLVEAFRGSELAPRPAGLPTTPESWTRHLVGPSETGGTPPQSPVLVAAGTRGIVAFSEAGTSWNGRHFMAASPDGRSWTTLSGERVLPTGDGWRTVAAWERGFTAVGDGEVWHSEDGRAWDSAPSDLNPQRPLWRVAAGGPGLVALGTGNRAWYSSDGVDWEPARVPPPPEGVYPGDDGRSPTVFMFHMAVAGERLVAAGRADRLVDGIADEWSSQPSLWASSDGMSWTDVTDPELFPEGSDVHDVAGGPQGFVAVGSDPEGFALWTSPDGLEWEHVRTDAFAGFDAGTGVRVAGGPAGYVAVTTRESQAAVWTSPDGRAWSRVPADPVFQGNAGDVVAWGSRFVIGGVDAGRAVVWISDDLGEPTEAPEQVGESPRPPCTAFERACGWIAYNDGTGIWAVDPEKTYPGTFSPSDHPDDTVRLAGPAAGDPIAWSADGSRLLVRRPPAAFRVDRQALFVLEEDGTETQVTGWMEDGFRGASISPDGTRVVYARGSEDPHVYRLEVVTVGDSPPEVLLSSQERHLGTPAFSPDGGRIAFIDGGGDHSNALWVIDADGTNRRKLAGGDWNHVYDLVWSPDGERLAFNCRCPAGEGVYTIRADGTRLTLVSADGEMPVPQWSPDGSQIALVHAHNDVITTGQPTTATLVIVGAEGGEEREVVHFELALVDRENPRRLTIAWNPAG